MSTGSGQAPATRLERPRRLRPPFGRRLVHLAWAAALGVGLAIAKHRTDCAEASHRDRLPGLTALLCRDEYAQTGDPLTGIRLAYAWYDSGKAADARIVAKDLLKTSRKSDAFRILGMVANKENRIVEAIENLDMARRLHREE